MTKEKAVRFDAYAVQSFIDKSTGEERRMFHKCGVAWVRDKVIQVKLTTLPIGGELVCFRPKAKVPEGESVPQERGTVRGVGRRG